MAVRWRVAAFATVVMTLGAPVRTASAQLQTGERVQVSLADDGRVTGTLAGLSTDSLVLEIAGERQTYPRPTVTRLEVSQGVHSRWKTGAVVGGVAGAVGTFVILNSGNSSASTNMCDSAHNQDAIGLGPCLALAGFAGGLGGALLGGVVGSLVHSERWSETPLEGVRLTFLPTGHAGILGVSLSFQQ